MIESKVNNQAALEEALMDPRPSMKYLLWYLEDSDVDISLGLPWNRDTFMFVLSYIFEFISNLDHSEFTHAIMPLDQIAKCLHDARERYKKSPPSSRSKHEIDTKQKEFSQLMLTSSFFPEVVRRFFTVPKLHQLPQSDKHLYPNEIIAGFMDFLLQVLYHQTNNSSDQVQRWAVVRKELSFLLAVLGDIPFQCTHHELVGQVTNLLAEFEILANEAGLFVYDDVFPTHRMEANEFHVKSFAWFHKVDLLTGKIREHCIKFSELPMSVISRTRVVDSFFIIHSLIEDIENLMNPRHNFSLDDDTIKKQIKRLHAKLTLSQSFIRVLQDIEEKECFIQIRGLTYETEYLIINSLVSRNIHVWYLNLRLPSIIRKIKLACNGLQQISDRTMLREASGGKISFPTTGDTAALGENHFMDLTDDIIQRILKDRNDGMKILEDGYKHLPRSIKPCFLYFAGFPKDSEISQEKLTWLWISEGFIEKEGNKSLEETAEMYLSDLINRKLVLIAKSGSISNGAIKKCRMQTVKHEFCVRKANEENFMKFTNGFSIYERCQRLCVPSTSCIHRRPFGLQCRSFRDVQTRMSSCFERMALLKVVDQSLQVHPICDGFPELAFPTQLRYLGVGRLSHKMVAKLINLEFIYVSSRNYRVHIPSVVLGLVKLRHLVMEAHELEFAEDCCMSNIRETTSLRTLSGVLINGKKDVEILMRWCPHLHKLKFTTKVTKEFPDLSFLAELESLKMCSFRFGVEKSASVVKFPSAIKKLSLRNCDIALEMMSILGKLPNLNVLKLEDILFEGNVFETRDGGFRKLQCLELCNCEDLKLLISCSEHFPLLECLVLCHCSNLLEIPSDCENILTLQRIQVTDCTKEAYISALDVSKQIQVDINYGGRTKDQLILELSNTSRDNLRIISYCMEEFFEARESQRFVNELTLVDQTEDKATDQTGDMMTMTTATTINDGDGDDDLILCNRQTYYIVVSYAMHFSQTLEKLAIMQLCRIAESYMSKIKFFPGYVDEIKRSRRNFSDKLVKSYIPQVVQRFFKLPNPEQLLDKHLKKNEVLASFMDFLLHTFSKVNTDSAHAKQYVLLQKELSFLLALLGDIPFQHTAYPDPDKQLNNLLAEFEMFANEVGGFLFSCVFPIQPMKVSRFHVETNALLEMSKLLNDKIKEHCSNFSKLPVSVIMRPSVVDSFFIVDSLVEDLQNITLSGQFGSFAHDDAIKEPVRTLHDELKQSQSFIKAMRENYSNQQKAGLIQITDLAYEAEYLINSFVARRIHVWYLILRLQSIVEKIKLAQIGVQPGSKTKVMIKCSDEEVSFHSRGSTGTIGDNQFLDFSPDIKERILNDLTGNTNSQQVILIFGMAGLGKTTTATELYNGKAAMNHFDRRAWCVVSEKYSVRALFIQILFDLLNEPDKNRKWEEKEDSELGVDIHKTLKRRRYLIVLDDVWHSDVLDKLRRYFPDDQNGSRVMITTRNKDVSPSGSILYQLPILSNNQCWNLLEEKVFRAHQCPSHLVSIGKRIAARCSGVPLAVVSIAGVLVDLGMDQSEWQRVEKGLDTFLLDDQSDYRKIMELSYEHLPHNIKPCFLYFARFREDAEISIKGLKWFWIAQGFIQKDGNKSPEEIADTYLLNLINRSLVMTGKRTSSGGIKTCKIHDLLRDICMKKADEENFFKSTNLFPTYVQHLRFLSSTSTYWRPLGLHCRSFEAIQTNQVMSSFKTMAVVKVVEIYCLEPPAVDLPFQLRYLGIGTSSPEALLGVNLVDLEILHVIGGHEFVLPPVILRLVKLRHLFVRSEAKFGEDCNDNISETTNLRSISRILIRNKTDEEILRKSPHLKTLKCLITSGETSLDLSGFAELESLRIDCKSGFQGEMLLSVASFPWTIKKLCLRESKLPWEKMSIIGELPKLEVLKLESHAFVGAEWETKDDQFQELKFLKIQYLDLKRWISESSHFPSLERLVLSECKNLVEIPSDLGYIPTLQRIVLSNCSKGACLSAFDIEEEQREVGNPDLQVYSRQKRTSGNSSVLSLISQTI